MYAPAREGRYRQEGAGVAQTRVKVRVGGAGSAVGPLGATRSFWTWYGGAGPGLTGP